MKRVTCKKCGRLFALAMAVLLMIQWPAAAPEKVSAATMSSITSESIRDKEQQIKEAQKEQKELQNSLSDLKKIKKSLESKKKDLKKYIAELDASLEEIEKNIAALKVKIEEKEADIVQTEAELQEALTNENNQKDLMYSSIKMLYEQNEASLIAMLMTAEGFGDMLNRADYAEKVLTYEQRMFEDYKNVRAYVELCKQQLETEKASLDEAKAVVEQEQSAMEELIEQKNRDLTAYENDISDQAKAIREYEAEIQAQKEEIEALEALIAEEKKKILAANGVILTYDGGAFKMPLAYYTRISDDYGWRNHPILHRKQFHNGVDFASPKGTAIYAAYDGVVVAAAYSSTMGKYIMIDHGSGLYTIYMHASQLYVAKDDIVVRGETIAAVGSTGRSTGNHLHFSVRLNGEYQSPWNYVKK